MNALSSRLTFKNIKAAMLKKGYAFFTAGEYNLNLVGIRSKDLSTNTFNDVFAVLFMHCGREMLFVFDATTDPGLFWLQHPDHMHGTAIMKPGQYRGLWRIGKHRNQYWALKQAKTADFYRDNNRDDQMDLSGEVFSGIIGANAHRASAVTKSTQVDRWSAGCQVLANPLDFNLLMNLCYYAKEHYGNSFTYTLLDEADIKLTAAKAAA